jgi:shikimate dehydrogenase
VTDRYAVIGNPVAHSSSPPIHALFAQLTGEDIHYCSILAPRDAFARAVSDFQESGGKGANVTLPFKEEAFAVSDEVSQRALAARAVNTLSFDGSVVRGDNTDGCGLTRDLGQNLGFNIRGRHVLLLGAGGAARGVLVPILDEQPASMTLANRSVQKAHALLAALPSADARIARACGYDELAGESFDLVINATSAGLTDAPLALPRNLFRPDSLAYDMVYGRDTSFMRQARLDGAGRTADGFGMLVEQAAESFFLWRGLRPPTGPVLSALRPA